MTFIIFLSLRPLVPQVASSRFGFAFRFPEISHPFLSLLPFFVWHFQYPLLLYSPLVLFYSLVLQICVVELRHSSRRLPLSPFFFTSTVSTFCPFLFEFNSSHGSCFYLVHRIVFQTLIYILFILFLITCPENVSLLSMTSFLTFWNSLSFVVTPISHFLVFGPSILLKISVSYLSSVVLYRVFPGFSLLCTWLFCVINIHKFFAFALFTFLPILSSLLLFCH